MRLLVMLGLCVISNNVLSGTSEEVRLALRNGALGSYVYRVVDDEGNAVSNALAHVWFSSYARPQDKADWVLQTDTQGLFSVCHRFNEKFSVVVDKQGYYRSRDQINYLAMPVLPVEDGKWQPYGELRTVVLNRIKDPSSPRVFNERSHRKNIPALGEWTGFDFEKGDWTAPYGMGEFDDVLLRFRVDERKRRSDYTYAMDVSFTNNPYAGAYLRKIEGKSDLKTQYRANTNEIYRTEFTFIAECVPGKSLVKGYLTEDSYLVFRTRTRVDAAGRLAGAHYGKVCGVWRSTSTEMLLNDGCFNPSENDTNIESDQALLNAVRNYGN